jgi:hypothetical protein
MIMHEKSVWSYTLSILPIVTGRAGELALWRSAGLARPLLTVLTIQLGDTIMMPRTALGPRAKHGAATVHKATWQAA